MQHLYNLPDINDIGLVKVYKIIADMFARFSHHAHIANATAQLRNT